jgi:hypothetical protein
MNPLGTDSCRGTVHMELPVPNESMHHREPKREIDVTRIPVIILRTISSRARIARPS